MKVIYSAAPFNISHLKSVFNYVDLTVVNQSEHILLVQEFGSSFDKPLLITKGSKGSCYLSKSKKLKYATPKVTPVDTTGAGDTYLGYFASYLDQGRTIEEAMDIASFAAALQVTKNGTSDAIPSLKTVIKFWKNSGIKTLTLD